MVDGRRDRQAAKCGASGAASDVRWYLDACIGAYCCVFWCVFLVALQRSCGDCGQSQPEQ